MVKGCHSVLLHKKDTFRQCKIHINVNLEIFICAMILAPLLFHKNLRDGTLIKT